MELPVWLFSCNFPNLQFAEKTTVEIKNFWRLGIIFIVCDAYYKWVQVRGLDSETMQIYELEWRFYGCLLQSFVGVSAFISLLCLVIWCRNVGDRWSQNANDVLSPRKLVEALLVSFYGNVLSVIAVIWGQSQSVSYLFLIHIFLFLSHVETLRAFNFSVLWATLMTIAAFLFQLAAEYAVVIVFPRDLETFF